MKIGNMDRDTVLHFCSEAELVLWCVRDGGSWVYRKQSGKLKTGFLQLIFSIVNPSHSKQNYSHFFHSSENVKKNISFSLVFSITQHKCDICFSPRLRTLSLSLTHTHTRKKRKKANGRLPFLKLLVSTSSEIRSELPSRPGWSAPF